MHYKPSKQEESRVNGKVNNIFYSAVQTVKVLNEVSYEVNEHTQR